MKTFDMKSKKKQSLTIDYDKLPSVTRHFSERFSFWFVVLLVTLGLSSFVLAWQNPTANPPGNNLSGFLDTSSTAQTKTGGLTIGGTLSASSTLSVNATTTLAISGGRVGIGTTTPASLLTVGASGAFQVDSSGNVMVDKPSGQNGVIDFM